MARRGVFVLLFTLVSGLIGTFAAVGASGPTTEEDGFAARAAAERSGAGLAAYAPAGDLVEVARRHAQRMASEDRLHHNPSLGSEVQGWDAVGENVGVGASVDDIHRAFMASSTHRHAILSTEFTQVGMGVAFGSDGRLWVAQVFRRPAAEAAAREEAAAAAVRERLGADLAVGALDRAGPPAFVLSTALPTPATVGREVTAPIGLAAALLLAVVLGLLAEVGRYPLSDWRRQRNQASISSSRSPSSTAWTLPVS